MLEKLNKTIMGYGKKFFSQGPILVSRLFGFGASGRVNDGWKYDVYAWSGQ